MVRKNNETSSLFKRLSKSFMSPQSDQPLKSERKFINTINSSTFKTQLNVFFQFSITGLLSFSLEFFVTSKTILSFNFFSLRQLFASSFFVV